MAKLGIVLFNLGGPDAPEAVRPFLFNLFNDPAIIAAPAVIRRVIAWLISSRRAPVAQRIYAHLGGRSPLLELTRLQAAALTEALQQGSDDELRVFVAMRYWHPLTEQVVAEVKAWAPDRLVLLPLYPQYSTTTTASSLVAWKRAAAAAGMAVPTVSVCCYPTEEGMIRGQADLLRRSLAEAEAKLGVGGVRVLFSAHGLPKKVVERGDPYQFQVEMTANAIWQATGRSDLDWLVSYQSRVGPMEWIGPATDAEIRRAGRDGKGLVVQPIAFVSEHSETLVELDIEYGHLAQEARVPLYLRVPALGVHPDFIRALADLVQRSLIAGCDPCSEHGGRICPAASTRCAHAETAS